MNQSKQDHDHLRLLSIFHYVAGGVIGLFSLFPMVHLIIGIAIVTGSLDEGNGNPPPAIVGWMFIVIPAMFIAMGMALAICVALAGRNLARRTGYLYCLVIAGFECMFMPIGTVLGVFTIIVLMRDSVQEMFRVKSS